MKNSIKIICAVATLSMALACTKHWSQGFGMLSVSHKVVETA